MSGRRYPAAAYVVLRKSAAVLLPLKAGALRLIILFKTENICLAVLSSGEKCRTSHNREGNISKLRINLAGIAVQSHYHKMIAGICTVDIVSHYIRMFGILAPYQLHIRTVRINGVKPA